MRSRFERMQKYIKNFEKRMEKAEKEGNLDEILMLDSEWHDSLALRQGIGGGYEIWEDEDY
ncbi:MAG: hypothetical protein KatS3mg079_645 [Caloramator sp.]|uniref:Uncharacterized protein n=1 Tax=Caloramator proteoclasticus DSM 10124 TaxID=1121262 RepID=A0A1M4ZH85_9CLOT|nr:hypothetical protein [Caloramator proteoclasticus]GIW49169.1 MAG: hypothetical protein KatS3mg079_645 [Caloramator sp.]SHF17403.1 hypothetical protein SAMN02746091_01928 [Caloramator proteoclasticus DSM 10124]